ncbi:MAG: protein serine/threonine phosphatase [Bryobacterales bacterium]|nr:protein serine/threonine phosphatase [Bryobacterales bacterium]
MPRRFSAGLTDQGNVRGNNEDRFHIDDERGIYMVVDGMGGQAAGEEAAEIAVKTLRARLERPTDSADLRVREAIALANNAIYEAATGNPEWRGMACVLTVAVVEDGVATIGHVGDSRLYFVRGGKIEKITKDHSPVGEREDAGELSEEAAMKHPRRNEVYRDVGSAARTPDDAEFIDVRKVQFPSDSALLLCSDGLSDVLPSRRILQLVEENAGDCKTAVQKLVKEAVADGKDNVSVVLVEGEDFSKPAPRAADPLPAATEKRRPLAAGWLLLGALLGLAAGGAYFLLRAPAPVPATPRTLRVALQGGEFFSIQEAIQHANSGDTIQLAPGHYIDRLVLRNGTHIVGTGESTVTGGIFADGIRDVSLEGFEVEGEAGINVRNSNVEIDRMRVTRVKGPGVEFSGESNGALRGSRITDNAGAGVLVRDTASPLIENNFIAGNNPGIEWLSSGAMRVSGNAIGPNGAEPLWLAAPPQPTLLSQNIVSAVKRPYKVVKP